MAKSRIRRVFKFSQSKGGDFMTKEQYVKDIESKPKRTSEEQLAHLDLYGLTATKERAKLKKRIEVAASKPNKKDASVEAPATNKPKIKAKYRNKKGNK